VRIHIQLSVQGSRLDIIVLLVRVLACKFYDGMPLETRSRSFITHTFLEYLIFLICHYYLSADYRQYHREYLYILRIPPLGNHTLPQVFSIGSQCLERMVFRKHRLGMLGGKIPAARGSTRLEYDRRPLRGRFDKVRSGHIEKSSFV